MDRLRRTLMIPLTTCTNTTSHYKIAISLCFSSSYQTLTVPSANVIFLHGDKVDGTENPVIERMYDLQHIADTLVAKFGDFVNAFVVEASLFNGPFAVYRDFIPNVNQFGEPKSYCPVGFPASTAILTLLSSCVCEAKNLLGKKDKEPLYNISSSSTLYQPKTYILGFSKGGTVLNQLVAELGFSGPKHSSEEHSTGNGIQIIPDTKDSLLASIKQIHYVDVGLNSPGAYTTNPDTIKRISICGKEIRFVLHGTPRQWCDDRRAMIRQEKEKMIHLLELEAQRSEGKVQVSERFYYAYRSPALEMHFKIIEDLCVD